MTKPGYGTIVEAVALQQPVVYVADTILPMNAAGDYLHRYGRGIELSIDDFTRGRWEPTLLQALAAPLPLLPPPPPTGAAEAAEVIVRYCHV